MPRYTISILMLNFIFMLIFLHCDVSCRKTSQFRRTKLLLILLSGFRWDYVKQDMKGFAKIRSMGVHAKYLLPTFPSLSFPNYYSLVTGLYPENHGMIMDYMYDVHRQEYFMTLPHQNSSQSFWWEQAEPMWITASRERLRPRLYLWPGGHVPFNGTVPEFAEPYGAVLQNNNKELKRFRQRLEDALQHLKSDCRLAQIYCELTDYVGHREGPNSKELSEVVEKIDKEIIDMIEKLEKLDLLNKVNVVIVSDHGMTTLDKDVLRVELSSYVNIANVQNILGEGAVVGVFPLERYMEEVYEGLSRAKEFVVWKKANIPEHLHIKNSERTPPIVVVAKQGYFINAVENTTVQVPFVMTRLPYKGYHGYDVNYVSDMKGIFYAFGPGLENDMQIESIRTVDIYNVMMRLLDLRTIPNNGSWKSVFKMIRVNSASTLWYEGISSVFICIGCIYIYSLIAFAHSVWI